jgi:hypothetical protein
LRIGSPVDAPITTAGAAIQLQGSSDGVTWVTLYSTTAKGTNGEIITSLSSNLTAGSFSNTGLPSLVMAARSMSRNCNSASTIPGRMKSDPRSV